MNTFFPPHANLSSSFKLRRTKFRISSDIIEVHPCAFTGQYLIRDCVREFIDETC